MRSRPVATVAAACLLVLAAGCATGSGAVDQAAGSSNRYVAGNGTLRVLPPAERGRPPQVSGTLLDGRHLDLRGLRGHVAVVNFWGSWCAPCRVETPEFQEVYADVKDEGVDFLGLNVKETSEQFATAFVDRFGIQFPSLYDPRGEVALAFRGYPANAIPSTIVLDQQGRVAAVYTGTVTKENLRTVIDRVLGEE
jgi:thiol-disulfide isomerase/thioredoxin